MKIIALIAACLGTAIFAAPVNAQDLGTVSAIASMKGKCTKMIYVAMDATSICVGQITNTMYKTGRSGFIFRFGTRAIVTFSGADSPAQGNNGTVRLDKVISTLSGTGREQSETFVFPATGSCTYTNPYAGPSRINCSATTKEGEFSASFVSDGAEPYIKRF